MDYHSMYFNSHSVVLGNKRTEELFSHLAVTLFTDIGIFPCETYFLGDKEYRCELRFL